MHAANAQARVVIGLLTVCAGCGAGQQGAGDGARLVVSIEPVRFDDAERRASRDAVAESVRARANTEHMDLPAAEVDGAPDPDAWPRIALRNDTAHGMLIWLSGPCARTIALPPHSQNAVEVCEGTYQVAGQISAGRFLPLVGRPEPLANGYQYTFTFYVTTDPYRAGHRRRRRRAQP